MTIVNENEHLPPEIRCLLGPKGDSTNWLKATAQFPNRAPCFNSSTVCQSFMVEYKTGKEGSKEGGNQYDPQLMHIFTMLTSWEQVGRVHAHSCI